VLTGLTFLDQPGRYNVPVYGVNLDGELVRHACFFDRIVYADSNSLDATLRSLARQLPARPPLSTHGTHTRLTVLSV
jgi:hypothetical protein